jgi:hypothetical protein
MPQAYEMLSKQIIVENSMSMRFVGVSVGLIAIAFFVILVLTSWEADPRAQWRQLW